MEFLVIAIISFLGSALTFFSGFGLGTILMPVYAVFFPLEVAIPLTGVVHLLNNWFKLFLIGKSANLKVVLTFGIPASVAAMAGAFFLSSLASYPPITSYQIFDHIFYIQLLKVTIGVLMIFFALLETLPWLSSWSISPRFLPLGGIISGFFGGLSGHQGALRSAFLLRCNLSKESFIASGILIACLVDLSRLATYQSILRTSFLRENQLILLIATASAFFGAFLGNRYLKKLTITKIQKMVAVFLAIFAGLMCFGLI